MKKTLLVILTLLASVTPGLAQAIVIVSEVHPTGSSNGTYNDDWFELTNIGNAPADITGWRFDDNSNTFALGAPLLGVTTINPGQSVVFIETGDPGASIPVFTAAWFGPNVPSGFTIGSYSGSMIGLSSVTDQVNIFDSAQNPIWSVGFGASTPGVTFDNAAGLSGSISQLSVAGVNGAFQSFDGIELGSPGVIGVAVPEPSSLVMLGMTLGCGGWYLLRRKSTGESTDQSEVKTECLPDSERQAAVEANR